MSDQIITIDENGKPHWDDPGKCPTCGAPAWSELGNFDEGPIIWHHLVRGDAGETAPAPSEAAIEAAAAAMFAKQCPEAQWPGWLSNRGQEDWCAKAGTGLRAAYAIDRPRGETSSKKPRGGTVTDQERETAWREWLVTRPDDVRAVAEHFPPWVPVRIKATGQKAHVYSFGEQEGGGICVQVNVYPDENPDSPHSILLPDGHRVFGLAPDDLEPWIDVTIDPGETPT